MVGFILTLIFTICCPIISFFLVTKFGKNWNKYIANLVFVTIIIGFYLYVFIEKLTSVGPDDWNFQNVLPLANMSPFLFTTSILFLIPSKKLKEIIGPVFCLLIVGMYFSPIGTCVFNILRHYTFHFFNLADAISHITIVIFPFI